MRKFTMRRPFDAHVHFRQLLMLLAVIEYTARWCSYAVIQPNKKPRPVLDGKDVNDYRDEILAAIAGRFPWFTPLMTCQIIMDEIDVIIKRLESALEAGAVAAKIYPLGVTNSDFGLMNYLYLYPVFEWMQKRRMRLLLHGESPEHGLEFMDAEKKFAPILVGIHTEFPELPISLEHIGESEMLDCVLSLGPSVVGGVTLQHMLQYMNDWGKQTFKGRNFCMPVSKYRKDRDAILAAALNPDPKYRKIRLGSDTAPHSVRDKQTIGCAGCFTAPVLFQKLMSIFASNGKTDLYEDFALIRSCEFFGVEPPTEQVTLVEHSWTVPNDNTELESFLAGETIDWQFEELLAA
jgi:dihydroorotase